MAFRSSQVSLQEEDRRLGTEEEVAVGPRKHRRSHVAAVEDCQQPQPLEEEEAKNRDCPRVSGGTQLCQLKSKSSHSNSPFIYSQDKSNSALTFGEDVGFGIMKTEEVLPVIDESQHDR